MGFLSDLGGILSDLLDSAMLYQAYPSLQDAVNTYLGRGYQISELTHFSAQLWTTGVLKMKSVSISVQEDGSSIAVESGLFGSTSVFSRRIGSPTPREFLDSLNAASTGNTATPSSSCRSSFQREDLESGKLLLQETHSDLKSAYETLGVSADTPIESVSRVFHDLISKYHPDRYAESPEDLKRFAEDRTFQLINAYKSIMEVRGGSN